jgi:hypothetical protein
MAILERIRFMKVNKHKRFDYSPRYYDERKERLDKLVKKHEKEALSDTKKMEYRERLKQRIADNWESNASSAAASRSANLRLIIILVVLLAAVYFILDYVDIFANDVTKIE